MLGPAGRSLWWCRLVCLFWITLIHLPLALAVTVSLPSKVALGTTPNIAWTRTSKDPSNIAFWVTNSSTQPDYTFVGSIISNDTKGTLQWVLSSTSAIVPNTYFMTATEYSTGTILAQSDSFTLAPAATTTRTQSSTTTTQTSSTSTTTALTTTAGNTGTSTASTETTSTTSSTTLLSGTQTTQTNIASSPLSSSDSSNTSAAQPQKSDNKLAIILGTVLGGLAVLGMIILIFLWLRRRRGQRQNVQINASHDPFSPVPVYQSNTGPSSSAPLADNMNEQSQSHPFPTSTYGSSFSMTQAPPPLSPISSSHAAVYSSNSSASSSQPITRNLATPNQWPNEKVQPPYLVAVTSTPGVTRSPTQRQMRIRAQENELLNRMRQPADASEMSLQEENAQLRSEVQRLRGQYQSDWALELTDDAPPDYLSDSSEPLRPQRLKVVGP